MRISAVLTLAVIVAGCGSRPDREPLLQFLHALENSLRTNFDDKLKGLPSEERKIRWKALFFREHVVAIEEYLARNPSLTARSRAVVESVRQNCLAETELFEQLVKEHRWTPTEAEEQRDRQLQADFQRQIALVGRIIDGKE